MGWILIAARKTTAPRGAVAAGRPFLVIQAGGFMDADRRTMAHKLGSFG